EGRTRAGGRPNGSQHHRRPGRATESRHQLRLGHDSEDAPGTGGGRYRGLLWSLTAVVGAVLLIACANLANLLLSRSASRRREIGIRNALGAARGRLIRQPLTESVLLAGIGAAVGLGLAWAATRLLTSFAPDLLARSSEIGIDWKVLGFTVAVAFVTGILFGL